MESTFIIYNMLTIVLVKFLIDSTSFNNALDLIMNSDLFTFHCMRMQNVLIDFIIGVSVYWLSDIKY